MGVDRRAALEAAFESAGEDETPKDVSESPEQTSEVKSNPSPPPAEPSASGAPEEKLEPVVVDTKATEVKAESTPTDQVDIPKPPNSWRPAVREQWAKLPPEVRQEVLKRERETEVALSQSANARKFLQEFQNVVQPFEHLIRAQNSTPLAAVDNMMRTAAALQTGTPAQKAALVAQIIQNYGIDLETLGAVLQNQPVKDSVNPNLQRELAPIYEFMNEIRNIRKTNEERISQRAQAAIEEIANEPFFEDLREDIADLLEFNARRGKSITLKEAYQQAIKLNPEISQIIEQRNKASSMGASQSDLAKSAAAAKSVAGAPRTTIDGKPKSRREAIEQAWGKT
jgi:hypothetical protein